ncbi:hypothetical protein BH10BAC5_BH10BAC5_26500 [soil metagenome]
MERIDVISNYIEESEKYLIHEYIDDSIIITNSKLPEIKFNVPLVRKEDVSEIYKNILTDWIVKKINNKEFIPVIDRVNINPVRELQKLIKIFDPTKGSSKPVLIDVNQIKIKK